MSTLRLYLNTGCEFFTDWLQRETFRGRPHCFAMETGVIQVQQARPGYRPLGPVTLEMEGCFISERDRVETNVLGDPIENPARFAQIFPLGAVITFASTPLASDRTLIEIKWMSEVFDRYILKLVNEIKRCWPDTTSDVIGTRLLRLLEFSANGDSPAKCEHQQNSEPASEATGANTASTAASDHGTPPQRRRAYGVPKREAYRRQWVAAWRVIKPLLAEGLRNTAISGRLKQSTSPLTFTPETVRHIIRAGQAGLLDE